MSTIGLSGRAPAAARSRAKASASLSRVHSSCRFTFSPSYPGHCHSMGKFHGAEMAQVNGDELFHPMSVRDRQQQGIDVREAQLTVAVQDCRRPLMIAFFSWQELDSALLRPTQNNQRCFGRAAWCDACPEQRV